MNSAVRRSVSRSGRVNVASGAESSVGVSYQSFSHSGQKNRTNAPFVPDCATRNGDKVTPAPVATARTERGFPVATLLGHAVRERSGR